MPGQKISTLPPVSDLQAGDQFVIARSGSTYKITGDKFASKTDTDGLSAYANAQFALKTTVTGLSSFVDTKFATNTKVDGLSSFASNQFALKTTVTGMSSYADTKFIAKPASASNTQVLSYNGSAWVAGDLPPAGLTTGDFPHSLVVSGYQQLPTGLIFQWGGVNTVGAGTLAVTFPISFPTACLRILLTTTSPATETGGGSIVNTVRTSSINTTGFLANTRSTADWGFHWLAIGY